MRLPTVLNAKISHKASISIITSDGCYYEEGWGLTVNHDTRVRQGMAFAFLPRSEQERAHGARLAYTVSMYR